MDFEATTQGKKFEITVHEMRSSWKVRLRESGKDWIEHIVDKKDYQNFEDTISFLFNGSSYLLDCSLDATQCTVFTRGSHRNIEIQNDEMLLHEHLRSGADMGGAQDLHSGMPGKIVNIMVKEGQKVKKDDALLVMEAMKMENELRATEDLTIKEVHVKVGENVESGALLIAFEPPDE